LSIVLSNFTELNARSKSPKSYPALFSSFFLLPSSFFLLLMKTIPLLGISFLVAIWASAIGILSVQNATPVSFNFLFLKSIQIPVGVVLALGLSAGAIAGALLQPLWSLSDSPSSRRPQFQKDRAEQDDTERLEEVEGEL
jgi:uncharacterized integral membrane protein